MTAVAAATEAACARGKCVYTRRDRRRASTTTPRVSRLAPFVVVVVVASPNSNSIRWVRTNPRDSIDRPIRDRGDLELDERWATRREVARRARVDRIGVNRPLRSVVGRGSGRRARRATGRRFVLSRLAGGLAYPRAIESYSSVIEGARDAYLVHRRGADGRGGLRGLHGDLLGDSLTDEEEVADMEADTTELQSETREDEREPSPERARGEGSRRVMTPEFDHRRGFISKKSFIHSFTRYLSFVLTTRTARDMSFVIAASPCVTSASVRASSNARASSSATGTARATRRPCVRAAARATFPPSVSRWSRRARARRERRRCAGSNARSGEPRRRRERRRGRGPEEGERGTPEEASAGADDVYV